MGYKKVANLVYWNSGAGIDRDVGIIEKILHQNGFRVRHIVSKWGKGNRQRRIQYLRQWQTLLWPVSVQFHFQHIHREQFHHGKQNYIFVNPEFTDERIFQRLRKNSTVLCKSKYAKSLFAQVPVNSSFTGFTSEDRIRTSVKKDYRKFLHVAGMSDYKGTNILVEAWRKNPQWPILKIVRPQKDREGNPRTAIQPAGNIEILEDWVEDDQLKQMQNEFGIHLCPSEMEGFGHYIVEGLSCSAVVVTTDAPPMNELVTPNHGFPIEAHSIGKSCMSDRWQVDVASLEATINQVLALPINKLQTMGDDARNQYELLDREFRKRVLEILKTI